MGRLNKEKIIGSFEKNKFIETSFNNEEEFNEAIKNLKEANIDYIITEKRIFTKWLMKGYFLYAITMDIVILGGIFYLIFFNLRG
tara:strand:- start:470 stop:724 length:255 start_codon:yes stop_codon:yes gene_type:complete